MLWYQWWWCMIECLCYRQYKVKHKNMFGIKSTVFIRFYFRRERKERNRIGGRGRGLLSGAWSLQEKTFVTEPGLSRQKLTPAIFEKISMVLCIILWVLSRNKKDNWMISPKHSDPSVSEGSEIVVLSTLLSKHINIYFIEECWRRAKFNKIHGEIVDIAFSRFDYRWRWKKIMNFPCFAHKCFSFFITTQTKSESHSTQSQ